LNVFEGVYREENLGDFRGFRIKIDSVFFKIFGGGIKRRGEFL
jgi:hypothetical protein